MLQRMINFFKKPYTQKGIVVGTLDNVLKLIALFVWAYLVYILIVLFLDSMITDYNPLNKLWWFSYCFSIFFGGTWLAYIALFMRDYNEEE